MAKRKNRGISDAALTDTVQLKVRFSEVDSMKVVWHGNYAKYFEDGREAFGLRFSGLSYADIAASGYLSFIVSLDFRFVLPLRSGEDISVETRYIDSPAAKICFEYVIRRCSDNAVAATGSSVQVFTDAEGNLELTMPEFYRKWRSKWLKEK